LIARAFADTHYVLPIYRDPGSTIRDLFCSSCFSPELDGLPSRYRDQYQERVKAIELRVAANLDEIAANIERELADVRARLIAEYRAQRRAPS
jgi:hypothetical protein